MTFMQSAEVECGLTVVPNSGEVFVFVPNLQRSIDLKRAMRKYS